MKKTSLNSSLKTSNLDREQYLYLTTRGRRSGSPREIEIWFTHGEGKLYVIAEYPTSQWVQNIKACSDVVVRVADQKLSAQARILSGDGEQELIAEIQANSQRKYGWGDGLVVEVIPIPEIV